MVRFVQVDAETCVIDGTLDGLVPGAEHGVAVHASGDFSGGCGADPDVLGGHYNPRGARHGSPVDGEDSRHVAIRQTFLVSRKAARKVARDGI